MGQEDERLLPSEKDGENAALKYTVKKPKRTIIMEPLFALLSASIFALDPLTSQYIYVVIGRKYNFSQAGIGDHTNGSENPCDLNTSDPVYELQQKVQSESTILFTWFFMCSSVLSIFSASYLGGVTDRVGRRAGLIIPQVGLILRVILTVLLIYFELNEYWLFLGFGVYGLFGDANVIYQSGYAYISDCTTQSNRSMRLLILDSINTICIAASSALMGKWAQASGFLWPVVCIGALLLVGFMYTLFLVPETIVKTPYASISVPAIIKQGVDIFRTTEKRHRGRGLKIAMLLFGCIPARILVSQANTKVLFFVNTPFCFSTTLIGYFTAFSTVGIFIGYIVGALLFTKWLKLSNVTTALISMVSQFLFYVCLGVAVNSIFIWAGIGVGWFQGLSSAMLRTEMSQLVDVNEQGSLFSIFTVSQCIFQLIFDPTSNVIYATTLHFYKGLVFLVTATLILMSAIVVFVYKIKKNAAMKKDVTPLAKPSVEYGSLEKTE